MNLHRPPVLIPVIFSILVFSSSAASATSLNLSGNYLYERGSQKLVLTFTEDGVVLFRRYEGRYTSSSIKFKTIPSESTWAPYIMNSRTSAKALICQYGNPDGYCSAKAFSTSGDTVKWGRMTFSKSDDSFKSSKFDKGPYSFKQLKSIFKSKFHLIK